MSATLVAALVSGVAMLLLLGPRRARAQHRTSWARKNSLPADVLTLEGLLAKLSSKCRRVTVTQAANRQQVLRQLAALLRAGRQSNQVWKELAELQQQSAKETKDQLSVAISQAAVHAQRGEDTAQPFRSWWPWLASCFQLAAQQGVPLADLLERYGSHLKEDQELEELVKVEAAGAKMTQRLLLILPLGGIGLSLLLGIDVQAIYFGNPLGVVCLLGGAILSLLATRTSARIIKDAGRRQ